MSKLNIGNRKRGMELVTLSNQISDKCARVLWRVGLNRIGIVDVTLKDSSEDAEAIAELAAIKHLLFTEKVFKRDIISGQGFSLAVSKGAIKKLAEGRSKKDHLKKYGHYFSSRLTGAEVIVTTDDILANADHSALPVEDIRANSITHEEVITPAMGRILVTQHAIDRYYERALHGKPRSPWGSLVKLVSNPDLVKVDLPPNVKSHKQKKYGADSCDVWKHPDGSTEFLIVQDRAGDKILVSIYDRLNTQKKVV